MEPPHAIHHSIFSYSSRGFFVSAAPYVQRLAGEALSQMLDPTLIQDTAARKRVEKEARRLVTGPWVSAHLAFYDIQTETSSKWRANLELLKNAVEMKQCDCLPRNVLEIHCCLADRFNDETTQLLSRGSKKPQERFSNASSKTIEANIDQDKFLGKHFWGPHGIAGQGRENRPIVLIGLNDVNELVKAAKSLDLKATRVLEGGRAILVLGGPENENLKLASKLEDATKDKHSPKDVLDPQSLTKHQTVLSSSPISGSLLQRACGQYQVKSKDIEIQWQAHRHQDLDAMSLQISRNHYDGWVAQFNLGALSGVMILDTDVHRLNARWMNSKNGSCRVQEWETDSKEGDNDGGDEIPACGPNHDGSRRPPPNYKVRFNGARQQFRPSTSSNRRPSRHVKTGKDDGNTMLYFRWLFKERQYDDDSKIVLSLISRLRPNQAMGRKEP